MNIYLDANATTPVLTQARAAALAAMGENFGNPSSAHGLGLRARALLDKVRGQARMALGAPDGHLLFTSGATEGIQTAVLSALVSLRRQAAQPAKLLLYGATEHKAVPEALHHWNAVLGLGLCIQAIPVATDGRHDLAWLRQHATHAGLVCTMAANNETGVISDLPGIEAALAGSPALWLVDGVQALGKLKLDLGQRRIDYAPFSGHKLYAPKGIGLLYVREGAPFTPLLAGGGQEGGMRSGTENMAGIAALGAVLTALNDGETFTQPEVLAGYRDRVAEALQAAFPGLVFNAPLAECLPTTLNFSVPGLDARLLLDLFDAADVQLSGGSACSAAQAQPSHVLTAMGLPAWQAASAIRLSLGPAAQSAFIDEACKRIRHCGDTLRASGPDLILAQPSLPADGLTRLEVDAACCYLLADAESKRCVVIDVLPGLVERLAQWLEHQQYVLAAVLQTRQTPELAAAAQALRAAVPDALVLQGPVELQGWPRDHMAVEMGRQRLTRLSLRGAEQGAWAYLLHDERGLRLAFAGDILSQGPIVLAENLSGEWQDRIDALRQLSSAVGPRTALLPGRDPDDRYACTLATEAALHPSLAALVAEAFDGHSLPGSMALAATEHLAHELTAHALQEMIQTHPGLRWVDLRDAHERRFFGSPDLGFALCQQTVPLSGLPGALPDWLALPDGHPVVFVCRSGRRSAKAAQVLRRLGREQAWSLAGGLALWPGEATARPVAALDR